MFDSHFKVETSFRRADWRVLMALVLASSELAAQSSAADGSAVSDTRGQDSASATSDSSKAGNPGQAPGSAMGRMTRPPELMRFVEAVLPQGTPARTEVTTVTLVLTVMADGSVSDVALVGEAASDLATAALEAVRRFEFRPAEIDGRPGAVRIQYEYVFEPNLEEIEVPSQEPAPAVASVPPPNTKTATGSLQGTLLERGTRRPLIGATVQVPALGLLVLTDEHGRFTFEALPAGAVTLILTDASHAVVQDTEAVTPGVLTELVYYADPSGFEEDDLVAVGRKANKQVVRREITVRELATVAGSQGDAVKAVQNLPGVARTSDDQLVMRGIGGAQVFVNGHPVLSAFHFGGLRSTIGSGMIESLEVTPGNYDARYGGALSGVIEIQTRRPRTDGVHGYAQVDVFDASAFVESGVGDNGAVAVGARRSYIDGILDLVLTGEAKETFQTAPRYYDAQGTYDWKLGQNRLRLNAFGARDEAVILLQEPDAGDPAFRGRLSALSQWFTVQALWDHRMSEDTDLSAGLSYLRGGSEQHLGQDFLLEFASNVLTWRTDLRHRIAPWISMRAGLDLHLEQIDFDVALPPPPKEGRPPPNLSTQESLRADGDALGFQPAAYAGLELKWASVLLMPSLRIEQFARVNRLGGEIIAQPRVDARWAVTERAAVKAGWGVYTDAPDIDESNEVFGNPEVEPQRALHYSLGFEQRLGRLLSLDMTGFYQDLYHQISPVDDPAIKYDNDGRGRVYGAELLLKHDPSTRFYGWVAYTWLRSERRDSGATEFRVFDLDQTHNLNVAGQYRLSPRWELGARFRYVSGDPTTPVVDAVYDSDADVYAPIYGRTNSERNDSFQQLDLRLDRHWIHDTWKLTAYLDVQNILNRQNAEGDPAYNFNYREAKRATGLPILPSFGVKGEF